MKKAISALGVLGLTVGLSACYMGNLGGPRVGDVGDSLTFDATQYIENAVGPDYAYQVNGHSGYTMAQQLPAIQAINNDQEGAPVDWIAELGTNDALQGNPNWQTDYNNEINAVSGANCVILVTVSLLPSEFGDGPVAADLDNAMQNTVNSDPTKYHLLPWGTFAYTNPAWISTSDGIHNTPAGQQELASLELQSLQQDC